VAALIAMVGLVGAIAFIVIGSVGRQLQLADFALPAALPLGLELWPFWLLIGVAATLAVGLRDRLVIATWAAIIAIALFDWMFAATGWAQFGYRYGLDFMPFLFLLVVIAVRRLRWYHVAPIGASVAVNLWGVLWIYQFAPRSLLGWTWVSF